MKIWNDICTLTFNEMVVWNEFKGKVLCIALWKQKSYLYFEDLVGFAMFEFRKVAKTMFVN